MLRRRRRRPGWVIDLAEVHEAVDPTLVARYEDGGLFEFVVSEGCPARRLAALGTLPREVLRSAYEAGYYERPRGTTGEEIANELGISPATVSQHLRAAERNLPAVLYDERAL